MPGREPQPWRTLETTWLIDHRWLAAVEDVVEVPGGGRLAWVRYPDEREGRARPLVASAICHDESGRVLVARQWNQPLRVVLDEFPGGYGEAGETAEEAVRRELQEEVGLYPGRLEHLGGYLTNVRKEAMRVEVYLATALEERHLPGDEGELIAWDWWAPAEVDSAIATGRFASVSVLAAWALYRARHPPA